MNTEKTEMSFPIFWQLKVETVSLDLLSLLLSFLLLLFFRKSYPCWPDKNTKRMTDSKWNHQ